MYPQLVILQQIPETISTKNLTQIIHGQIPETISTKSLTYIIHKYHLIESVNQEQL